ncbi:MAG: bifunctional alpha,alpha-trehalose-phosphate synthase (UDP-forming)/trehalose-phosphatase [Polyangiaceae bacterium]|nr:bifunctional alpha,alpha-trehalose-phosphate synthase (UDP-forming)/trehalose-phosphatase [Polyangiaceae bacterium]NUQ79636.1 bifunctional alpha,alpha-trehalose-phosphate synthase (UDP-forming)/trehalose-phosphatase [Polyangiaceae bacterium]
MPRLLLVSCRLPVTVRVEAGSANVIRSPGGLATGLRGPHERSEGLWLGWPGDLSGLTGEQRETVHEDLRALRVVPLELSESEINGFYEGFSNRVLWPLFHYLLDQVPLDSRDWGTYQAVNRRFAEAIAERLQPGDLVWIHDYQLMLVPGLLRELAPKARIGFFLHIPFPASEVFRILPWREEILRGLLGADVIGFHTFTYLRHFTSSLLRIVGIEADVDRISFTGRHVQLGAFPMGVDAAALAALVEAPQPLDAALAPREKRAGERIVLGVDRLDYTKGIPRRLLAFERVLERHPELRGKLRMIQVAVPSRTQIPAYEEFRRRVDEMVGRINGQYGTIDGVPIHYLYQSFNQADLAAMYRAADVMLVTPLRDGMNLVAKEFVASRTDDDGVLILSEFAGAASELGEALIINPYDVDGVATAIVQAISMPAEERAFRMRALRQRVTTYDVHYWVRSFLDTLTPEDEEEEPQETEARTTLPPMNIADVTRRLFEAPRLVLLLDYDGTLMPFSNAPDLARPDAELFSLLQALTMRPATHVHIVSGRSREPLASWLSGLSVVLHTEHGYWTRHAPDAPWTPLFEISADWKLKVLSVLQQYAAKTPGARIEEKTTSIAWHYRMADPEYGAAQAKELRFHLASVLSNAPMHVLRGEKVVEVRLHGIHKGVIPPTVMAQESGPYTMLIMGDDRTDEDMFAAAPAGAVTVHVGHSTSIARYRLSDWKAARAFLRTLVT